MTVNVSTFRTLIAPDVPLCPNFVIDDKVIDTCRDFCRKTHAWDLTLDRISIVASTQSYTLTVQSPYDTYGEIFHVQTVKYKEDGAADDQFLTLEPVSPTYLDRYENGNWEFAESAQPSEYWVDEENILYLKDIPDTASASGLLVKVKLMPIIGATVIPDFINRKYQADIINGTKHRLMRIKDVPWSDPQMSEYYETKYRDKRDEAQRRHDTGNIDRKSRLIPGNFAI